MPRTLLVTLDFPPQPGGVARYLWELASRLPADQLVVLAPTTIKPQPSAPFTVIRRRLLWRWLPILRWLPLFWHIWRAVRRERIECLWVAQPLPVGVVARILQPLLRCPYLVNTHGMDVAGPLARGGRKRWLLGWVLRGAGAVTTNSEYTTGLVRSLGLAPERLTLVTPGVTIAPTLPTPAERTATRQRYGYSPQDTVVISIARLVERKGIDLVLRALATARQTLPTLRYCVIGDGVARAHLVQLAQTLGLADCVRFLGNQTDAGRQELLGAADIFILPARAGAHGDVEGFGIVFLEAAERGVAAIAGASGGQAEAVIDGGTGLVVPPTDGVAIADALVTLATDERLRRGYGGAGRQRVIDHFQWADRAKIVGTLLDTITSSYGAS